MRESRTKVSRRALCVATGIDLWKGSSLHAKKMERSRGVDKTIFGAAATPRKL